MPAHEPARERALAKPTKVVDNEVFAVNSYPRAGDLNRRLRVLVMSFLRSDWRRLVMVVKDFLFAERKGVRKNFDRFRKSS